MFACWTLNKSISGDLKVEISDGSRPELAINHGALPWQLDICVDIMMYYVCDNGTGFGLYPVISPVTNRTLLDDMILDSN